MDGSTSKLYNRANMSPPNQPLPRDVVWLHQVVSIEHAETRRTKLSLNDFWAISVLTDDGWETRVGDGEWIVRKKGSANLYAPGTRHEQRRRISGSVHFLYCCFYAGEPFSLRRIIEDKGVAQIEDPGGRIFTGLREMAKVWEARGKAGMFRAQALLFELLNELGGMQPMEGIGRWRMSVDGKPYPAKDFVERVRAQMWPMRHGVIRLDTIARALHISKSGLSHRYREETGESPLQTQVCWRMEEASQLLTHDMPIKAIAEHLGYCDLYHFSKAFKRHTGVGPRRFREDLRKR